MNNVEKSLDKFPHTIERLDLALNSLIDSISYQERSFVNIMGGFKDKVDYFSNSLVSYGRFLDSLVSTSNRQLTLIADYQERIVEKAKTKSYC